MLPQVAQGVRKAAGGDGRRSHEKLFGAAAAESKHTPSGIFLSYQGRGGATLGCRRHRRRRLCCCCCRTVCQHVYRPPAPPPCHLQRQPAALIIGTDSPRCLCHGLLQTHELSDKTTDRPRIGIFWQLGYLVTDYSTFTSTHPNTSIFIYSKLH